MPTRLGFLLKAIVSAALLCSSFTTSHAQTLSRSSQPWLYAHVQDGFFVKRINSRGHAIPESEVIAAAYRYEMIYDSTSRVQYLFTECMHNSTRPRLLAWKNSALHSSSPEMMSDSSRTASFTVSAGDTISFFREFKWYNPMDNWQDTNNFLSSDTLDYSVELVSATTGGRLALLDSFGVLPRSSPSVPVFYGTRPIMARVRYIVPASLSGDTVFVRVRLYVRGDGDYLPIRLDDYTIGASNAVDIGLWDTYLSLYGGPLNKRSADDLISLSSRQSQHSLLHVSSPLHGLARIEFSTPAVDGAVSIVVYDMLGAVVFAPYLTRTMRGSESITYQFPASGTYFVALLQKGSILEIKKVAITL